MVDIVITSICFCGVIYEAIIAESFEQFLGAETMAADIFRVFKSYRMFVLMMNRKYFWKEFHDLMMIST